MGIIHRLHRFSQMDKLGSWRLKNLRNLRHLRIRKMPPRLPCLVFFISLALCLCVRNFNSCSAREDTEGGG